MRPIANQLLSFHKQKLSVAMLLLYFALCASASAQDQKEKITFVASTTIQATPLAMDANQVRPSCFLSDYQSISQIHSDRNYITALTPTIFQLNTVLSTRFISVNNHLAALPFYCSRTTVLRI